MIQHLQQYCGLMAKLLIEKIKQSEQLPQLKACQMQWITQLQESRILPQNLNAALQQVNRSMRTLQGSYPRPLRVFSLQLIQKTTKQ